MNDVKAAYERALRLLARREHGAHELCSKLIRKGFSKASAQDALHQCQCQGYQSDLRFAESICRTRMAQGYGPLRIKQELNYLRIEESVVESALTAVAPLWEEHVYKVWSKKFPQATNDALAIQKQKKFLLYRGFSHEIIKKIFIDD